MLGAETNLRGAHRGGKARAGEKHRNLRRPPHPRVLRGTTLPVRRLYLLRHAKSSWDAAGVADHDRPLAPRGRRAGELLRRFAAAHDVRPTLVLCSTAARVHETLQLVLPALGSPAVAAEERLYLASADDLLGSVRELPGAAGEAMIVGHNPGLHDLALALVDDDGRADLEESLPTGALVTLDLPVAAWAETTKGCARLVSLVRPRDL